MALDEKVDLAELEHKYIPQLNQKAGIDELEVVHGIVSKLRVDTDAAFEQHFTDTSALMQANRKEIDYIRSDFISAMAGKADSNDTEKVFSLLVKKVDNETFSEKLKGLKQELEDSLTIKYHDLKTSMGTQEANLAHKLTSAEETIKNLTHESKELTQHLSNMSDRTRAAKE